MGLSHRAQALAFVAGTMLVAEPSVANAQQRDQPWRVTGEVGGVLGGTWLRGIDAPTVSTDPGASIAVGAQRTLRGNASGGVAVRIGAQQVVMKELGTSWSGGTMTESDVLGVLSLASPQGTLLRPSLEVAGGVAVITGAGSVLPFRDASRFAPVAEVGLSVRRESPRADAQDFALFVHLGVLRLDLSQASADVTSGWVTGGWVRRVIVGLRVTR